MSYQTALSGLDWSMVPSGMTVPPAGISAMTQYEGGMASILAGNNIGYITANVSSGNYAGTINDVVYDTIVVSGTASANITISLYTDSNNGHKKYQVYIPATCLVASSGGPYTLTITTGTGSCVYVPIAQNGDTLLSPSLLFNIYVDSNGNVTSDDWQISGSNSNGKWLRYADGTLFQQMYAKINGTAPAYGFFSDWNPRTVTFPASFIDTTYQWYSKGRGSWGAWMSAELDDNAKTVSYMTGNVQNSYNSTATCDTSSYLAIFLWGRWR
jgi:hypothetical protein